MPQPKPVLNEIVKEDVAAKKRENSTDPSHSKQSNVVIQSRRGHSLNDKGEVIASRITNASKSPDKYVVGNSLVISLNDSTTSPNGNKKDSKNIYAT